ncbi:DNA binding protein [Bacillus phage Wip1]|uniref:Putative LexA-like repressor n=1 Tax=Bacillus phage Wip1 TaxID=663237 RepID=S5Y6I2_9VIRU|nr:DNA binding protein [Bacillus phage Wip1]AGT13362.1 putative LexA-like repressor [Bacillus phage Wip1]
MMNDTEKTIFNAIENFQTEHGYSPSLTELEEETFYSRSTVRHCIKTLEEKGYLELDRQVRRNIRLRNMSAIIKDVKENINDDSKVISVDVIIDILNILHNELSNDNRTKRII